MTKSCFMFGHRDDSPEMQEKIKSVAEQFLMKLRNTLSAEDAKLATADAVASFR